VKAYLCRVLETRTFWADMRVLAFDAPDLGRAVRPGQFAHARDVTMFDPYLRRTLWLYASAGDRVAFILPERDPLAARAHVGVELDLLAPLGNAIEFDANVRRVLLLGESTRIVQLIALAHAAITQAREVVLVHRGTNAFPAHLLAPEIEYRTDDPFSAELIAWADAIVASGTTEMYRALGEAIRVARYRLEPGFARVFVDAPMPCSTGVCYVCAVETSRGVRRVCTEGPAFDLSEFEDRRAQ
jgi:dihydroorotate dehydrogenase electron transfer subunit